MRVGLLILAPTIALALSVVACGGPPTSEGEALYRRYGCATCHGASGQGDGPLARTARVAPADLTDPAAYRLGRTEAAIADTILQGVPGPGGGMPPYPQTAESERLAMARWLIALSGGDGNSGTE